MSAIAHRYEFVYLFDVTNGNPNGDPDAGNLPRLDPETNRGLVTDVALKRKIRNYVALEQEGQPGHAIYMREKSVLNSQHELAWKALNIPPDEKEKYKKLPKDQAKAQELTSWMCSNFFDVRTFGAVMTTEINTGQVRGPVQLAFATSVEPVLPLEVSITRMAVTNEKDLEKERTMGRKHILALRPVSRAWLCVGKAGRAYRFLRGRPATAVARIDQSFRARPLGRTRRDGRTQTDRIRTRTPDGQRTGACALRQGQGRAY